MNFTLIQPSFKGFAAKQPPLGLAYLGAVLRQQKGAGVCIIDANCEELSNEETAHRVLASNPDVVGVTITTPLLNNAQLIINLIREQANIPIIVGGPHPTIMPDETLKAGGINIVVRGEGEKTIEELYRYFLGEQSLESISGISYVRDGKMIHNESRQPSQNLDELPFPAWELLPVRSYRSEVRKTSYSLPVMTSRGCPFDCIFCYKGVFGTRYRPRSPQSVAAEWEYLVKTMEVDEISVVDDNFTLDTARVTEICDLIIERNLVVPWTTPNGIRAKPASLELFTKMKEAGCYRVYFGVESGDQTVLDFVGKKVTTEEIRTAFRLARQAGLETGAFFMLGNLSETEQTMDKTLKFAVELEPDYAQFTIATPYPGTKMYETIQNEGRFLFDSWEELASYDRAVFIHQHLTPELINRKYRQAFRNFYFRPSFIIRHLRKLRTRKDITSLFWGIKEMLKFNLRRTG